MEADATAFLTKPLNIGELSKHLPKLPLSA
jgi:hypothetical protein